MQTRAGRRIDEIYSLPSSTPPSILYAMPLKGHQRTVRQKAQTAALRKQQHLPKSPLKAKTIDLTNPRLFAEEQRKVRKIAENARRSELNGRRRERRIQEKLEKEKQESQVRVEEAVKAVEERYEGQREEWKGEKESLKKQLAKLNARNRREPSKIQHAVQKALKNSEDSDATQPTVRYVKDKRGVVRSWARNAIVTLVNEGVPMSKTWSVTKANADALEVTIVGSWSNRTSRRAVREGGLAAGLMMIEYVLACIG
jgi:hypothetical protein